MEAGSLTDLGVRVQAAGGRFEHGFGRSCKKIPSKWIGRPKLTENRGQIPKNMVNIEIIKIGRAQFYPRPLAMNPKLIKGKVWIHVASAFGGGYQKLPENDPKYQEILLRIDSQRFVELLDWVYNRQSSTKARG
jgi:hypothetical protein